MKKQKIIINSCRGGFGLSAKAIVEYAKLKGKKIYFYTDIKFGESYKKISQKEAGNKNTIIFYSLYEDIGENPTTKQLNGAEWLHVTDIERNDLDLIKVVKELGKKANDRFSDLKIIIIPANIEWQIGEYDGNEWVSEQHRTWD